jgi:hypothetical protein
VWKDTDQQEIEGEKKMEWLSIVGNGIVLLIGIFSLLTWISKVFIMFAFAIAGKEDRDLPYAEAFLVSIAVTYFLLKFIL